MLNLQFNDRFNLLIGENVSMCTANSDILKKKMKEGAAGMKRLCLLALALFAGLLLIPDRMFAQDNIRINLNGEIVGFQHQPIFRDGTVMVPFRELFESMNLIVNYDPNTKLIRGREDVKPWIEVAFTVGKKQASISGINVELAVSPIEINGNTYVPLRFVGEATRAKVSWDQLTKTVVISERPESLLEKLCKKGDVVGVNKVLAENPGLDLNRDNGEYLFSAILYGNSLGSVQALVNAGADVNLINSIDSTALILASSVSSDMVQFLLDHGADPNIKDSNGQTALSGIYINSEDRKKTAEILKKVTKQDMDTGVTSNSGSGAVSTTTDSQIAIQQLPYEIMLPKDNLKLTIQNLSENELGYIFQIQSVNTSPEKGVGASLNGHFLIRTGETSLKVLSYKRISGNDGIGYGSAVYELILEKPTFNPDSLMVTVMGNYLGQSNTFSVDTKNMAAAPLTFQQLEPYLRKKYSRVITDSGVADFNIKVWNWNNNSYRIEVEYDTQFFWQKDIMTPIVQEQLREHMKGIARDVIQRFPDISFVGAYGHSWYKYPHIKVDLKTSDHMTWDTRGSNSESDMPSSFRWTPDRDDTLFLF